MGGGAEGTEADRHIRLILIAVAAAVEDCVGNLYTSVAEYLKLMVYCSTSSMKLSTSQWAPDIRKSHSISPRRRKSRSPITRHHKSRSPTPKHYKRQRSRSSSLSPVHKSSSPSLGSIERKNACEKLKKEEEDRKRRQQEAELKLIEEETAKRVEEAIQKKVEERLNSEEIKQEIQKRLEEGRRRLNDEVAAQLEKEKEAAILEARKKEEVARKENEELEKMLEENRKRVEETQRREAMEQQRREEERYRELEELQRQKEEAMKRKKQQEEEERLNQMKLLGKNKLRPKLSFALGSK
ncbi:Ribosomal protein S7 [Gossypium australe]|uniref:Ribosomal protein S7 n=1 Tax=Gossypium australe TaxID=47621 RepID=A0A5B6UTW7_9ROSI|nr:Ribosomal protein S7 [Gossypium australe]